MEAPATPNIYEQIDARAVKISQLMAHRDEIAMDISGLRMAGALSLDESRTPQARLWRIHESIGLFAHRSSTQERFPKVLALRFIGRSGAGKSSLANRLLGYRLLPEGSSDYVETAFPLQVASHLPDTRSDAASFDVNVIYKTRKKWLAEMSEADRVQENEEDKLSALARRENEQLREMLHPGCDLNTPYRRLVQSKYESVKLSKQDELNNVAPGRVEAILRERSKRDNPEGPEWAIIDRIAIHGPTRTADSGVDVWDFPGFDDASFVRSASSRRMQLQARIVVFVLEKKRSMDNQQLQEFLQDNYERGYNFASNECQLVIAITHCDAFALEEALPQMHDPSYEFLAKDAHKLPQLLRICEELSRASIDSVQSAASAHQQQFMLRHFQKFTYEELRSRQMVDAHTSMCLDKFPKLRPRIFCTSLNDDFIFPSPRPKDFGAEALFRYVCYSGQKNLLKQIRDVTIHYTKLLQELEYDQLVIDPEILAVSKPFEKSFTTRVKLLKRQFNLVENQLLDRIKYSVTIEEPDLEALAAQLTLWKLSTFPSFAAGPSVRAACSPKKKGTHKTTRIDWKWIRDISQIYKKTFPSLDKSPDPDIEVDLLTLQEKLDSVCNDLHEELHRVLDPLHCSSLQVIETHAMNQRALYRQLPDNDLRAVVMKDVRNIWGQFILTAEEDLEKAIDWHSLYRSQKELKDRVDIVELAFERLSDRQMHRECIQRIEVTLNGQLATCLKGHITRILDECLAESRQIYSKLWIPQTKPEFSSETMQEIAVLKTRVKEYREIIDEVASEVDSELFSLHTINTLNRVKDYAGNILSANASAHIKETGTMRERSDAESDDDVVE